MALSESLRKQIADLVASNRVVLFMKGTPRMPQFGFSAQVVQILDELLPSHSLLAQQVGRRILDRSLPCKPNNPIVGHGGGLLSAETLVSTTSFQQRSPPPSTRAHTQDSVIARLLPREDAGDRHFGKNFLR